MRHFKFWALLIAPVLILSSCKKSSSVHPTTAPTTPGISFKVNGTADKTDSQAATFYSAVKQLNVGGVYNDKNSNIAFIIPNAQVGTFDVATDHITIILADNGTTYQGTTGTFTITAMSATSVSGTFQFTADVSTGAKANVTEGQFMANVTAQ